MYAFVTIKNNDSQKVTIVDLAKEDLEEAYTCLSEHNLIDEIHTEEEMREFCLYHIKQGNFCAHTLLSVEENPGCEYFGFDMAGWSDADAEPLLCAEDMIECVI